MTIFSISRTIAILSISIFCNIYIAQGQHITVSGFVSEEGSGEVLTGATIYTLPDGKYVSHTNSAGFYSLKVPTGYNEIVYSFIGYAADTIRLTIDKDTTIQWEMRSQHIQFGGITVTAKRIDIMDVKGLGTIGVNAQQIRYAPKFLGESDIIKQMQLMPGVSGGKEASSQLAVRGGSGDQTLIMLDDVPVFNQNHAFGFVSIFNGDAISSANIYKGYVPAKYGGRLSSVAAIKMRDGNRYEHHQSVTVGTIAASLLTEGPIKKGKGSYLLSARGFMPYLFLEGLYAIRKNNADWKTLYSFYDITAKLNYSMGEKNTLYLSFYNGRDKMSNDNYEYSGGGYEIKDAMPVLTPKQKIYEYGFGYEWSNTSASIRANTVIGNKGLINNSIYFSQLGNKQLSHNTNFEANTFSNTSIKSSLYEVGFRSSLEYRISSTHMLNTGFSGSYQEFSPQNASYNKNGVLQQQIFPYQALYTGTLYAEDEIQSGIFRFNVGSRISASSIKGNNSMTWSIEPRVALTAQTDVNNSTWISYNRMSQPLFSATKLYMNFPLDFWLPSSKDKPETANQLSVGWKNTKSENLIFTTEAYYKKMSNLSMILSLDDYLQGEEDPIPATGRAYGIELMGQYKLNRFSAISSYTYSRTKRTAEGITFPFAFDAPHRLSLSGNYKTLERNDRNHYFSLNTELRSGYPYRLSRGSYGKVIESSEWLPSIDDVSIYPNVRLKPYFRTDISYAMERKKRVGSRLWQISILNVTNYKNPYIIYKEDTDIYKYGVVVPIFPSISYKRTF